MTRFSDHWRCKSLVLDEPGYEGEPRVSVSFFAPDELDQALSQLATRVEALQQTPFWTSDKAVLVLTGNRQIWLEATSNASLTLRPPHGSALGVDLVRGHFVTEELWRSKLAGVR